ncbi:MAG: hypothetical protein EB084_12815 [Proteobacteria bacterium]|nr:hypothetical protein [Pseudomonadota bacterium]
MSQNRDRALNLFTFLRELTRLRTRTTRTIEEYAVQGGDVLWLDELPSSDACWLAARRGRNDTHEPDEWLQIRKPDRVPAPEPPAELRAWLDAAQLTDSSRPSLDLRDRIAADPKEKLSLARKGRTQEVDAAFAAYLVIWKAWAAEDHRRHLAVKAYAALYTMHQKQMRLGETFEVILGAGFLAWKTPNGSTAKRHVLTARCDVSFDTEQGLITVTPAAEGMKLSLEQDMLDTAEAPPLEVARDVEELLAEVGDDLFESDELQAALQLWADSIGARYDNTLARQKVAGDKPTLHFAPAIIVRKRTERSLLRFFDRAIDDMSRSTELPLGVERLVSIIDDARKTKAADADDIYFPLQANDEQMHVARAILQRQGVLVQGPPGTGKSHNIANLVCHLLATGQRVLVTSHTSRALKVLKDKFPADIAPLCVTLLGDDQEAMRTLEESVQAIVERSANWTADASRKTIRHLRQEITHEQESEVKTLRDLRDLRMSETVTHDLGFGHYKGTAQVIARQLRDQQADHGWMPETPDPEKSAPITNDDALLYYGLLRDFDAVLDASLDQKLIDLDAIPTPGAFVDMLKNEESARGKMASDSRRDHPAFHALTQVDDTRLQALVETLESYARAAEPLLDDPYPWVPRATMEALEGNAAVWQELFRFTQEHMSVIERYSRETLRARVAGISEGRLPHVRAHAEALTAALRAGRKLTGLRVMWPRELKEASWIIDRVKVDNRRCDNLETLEQLLGWLDARDRLLRLIEGWSERTRLPSTALRPEVAVFQKLRDELDAILSLGTRRDAAKVAIDAIGGLMAPAWHQLQAVRALQWVAVAARNEKVGGQARGAIDSVHAVLRDFLAGTQSHDAMATLEAAVNSRDEHAYTAAYKSIVRLLDEREKRTKRLEVEKRLRSRAPQFDAFLRETLDCADWELRLDRFEEAWDWARAGTWLTRLFASTELERLSTRLDEHRAKILALRGRLTSEMAWNACFERMTEHEQQHLRAWTMAVRRVGKGKGRYADKHRQAARAHLDECRSAIPAWVMPIYRVAESIEAKRDAFEVVVVDEASQSGTDALFLMYLAKRIVVVGDDKQISPDNVGISAERVEALRQRYLADVPHGDALGIEHSFFDQAAIRFSGRIRLREHFRSMREIIAFSNIEFYRSEPLIPLRQYGSQRLEPPVAAVMVENAVTVREGDRTTNPLEAAAIVDRILACIEDARYAGKSFGVISLLGEAQANLIHEMLVERLGPEKMEARGLVCGDAYAFQGDERDVMFLSLVVAPQPGGRALPALADQRAQRRFNVAASRARDQMWLFHSVTVENLSRNCLRRKLLEYFLDYEAYVEDASGQLDVEEVRRAAASRRRTGLGAPAPFRNWFEVDVFLRVSDRGYTVLPRQEVANCRIDLAVQGATCMMAVECQGEDSDGAERYEEDLQAQRVLERCGWTFWRLRGSAFYRDPAAALQGLWETLQRLGIEPTREPVVESDCFVDDNDELSGLTAEMPVVSPSSEDAPEQIVEAPPGEGVPPGETFSEVGA